MNKKELLKTAKPILFNTDMVKAILDGKKTETRRTMKPQPWNIGQGKDECRHEKGFFDTGKNEWACRQCGCGIIPMKGGSYFHAPYQPEDILYVRETWQYLYELDGNEEIIEGTGRYYYAATDQLPCNGYIDSRGVSHENIPWKPSIHMPKAAARIWLKVTDVRAERLQDITEEQAKAEGAVRCYEELRPDEDNPVIYQSEDEGGYYVPGFKAIWNSTVKKPDIKKYGWEANPWVWVIGFKKINARSDNE